MPNLTDFRQDLSKDTSFYVYDDLRAWQKGQPDMIYRYDTLFEAIEKFRALPDNMTHALGISYQGTHEVDMVQTNRGEPFLVSDYLRMDFVNDIPNHDIYLETVIRELHLEWKSEHELFGNHLSGVLIPIDEGMPDKAYLNNKLLRPQNERYPFSAIQEFFNEGAGWQNYDEIVKAAQIIYGTTEEYRKPRISKLSVDYIEPDSRSGRIHYGTMDMNIAQYRSILEKSLTKEKPEFTNRLDAARNRQSFPTEKNGDRIRHERQRGDGQYER